jgi:hypothetical protein
MLPETLMKAAARDVGSTPNRSVCRLLTHPLAIAACACPLTHPPTQERLSTVLLLRLLRLSMPPAAAAACAPSLALKSSHPVHAIGSSTSPPLPRSG